MYTAILLFITCALFWLGFSDVQRRRSQPKNHGRHQYYTLSPTH